jgi:hypothetical protein
MEFDLVLHMTADGASLRYQQQHRPGVERTPLLQWPVRDEELAVREPSPSSFRRRAAFNPSHLVEVLRDEADPYLSTTCMA